MKTISGFMSEISDEFKVIVIEAIRSLCLKFPSKQATMLTFLSGVLRDEGGYDFKRAVVEAIFDMIKSIGSVRRPRWATCASLSKTASSPSSLSVSCTFWESRGRGHRTRQSTSGTFTIGSCWRMRLSVRRRLRVLQSLG
jgi:hypothetical protein